jgi:hypothetical protein
LASLKFEEDGAQLPKHGAEGLDLITATTMPSGIETLNDDIPWRTPQHDRSGGGDLEASRPNSQMSHPAFNAGETPTTDGNIFVPLIHTNDINE